MKKRLLSALLALCMVLTLLPGTAFAATYPCGVNVTWSQSGGTLTISGTGDMYDFDYYEKVPWYPYRNSIDKVVIEPGVTSIANYAFYECSFVDSIIIPDGITSIGDYAFYRTGISQNVIIPDSVTHIGAHAFENNNIYDDSTLWHNGVLYIGNWLIKAKSSVISNNYNVREGTLGIADSAFYGCGDLTNITIPDSVTNIGAFAFAYCSSLISIDIPDSVTSIGAWAFEVCSSLTCVTIPTGVTSIERGTFTYCDSLMDVYYSGSEEQWKEISISDSNNPLTKANIHFQSGASTSTPNPGSPSEIEGEYTHFGKLDSYNRNGSAIIDGVTYQFAAEFKDSSSNIGPIWAGDYTDNYIYALYSLDADNKITALKYNYGVICKLESWDAANLVVGTKSLYIGDYRVSDIVKGSFPTSQIASWVGDDIRIYTDGQEIFKIIHVTYGKGVITNYDLNGTQKTVYLDNKAYGVADDSVLLANIKASLSKNKNYTLYDNTLVELAQYTSYLAVDINNTGKSYYVGDEIRLFIYDCTETDDDWLSCTNPEGLSVRVSDTNVITYKKYTEFESFTECVFTAEQTGSVTIYISDEAGHTPINIALNIVEDKYQSHRADKLPIYKYDNGLNRDFYNAYVDGMYITDFSYTQNRNETYTFDFTVYNETYVPGVVEVYNKSGELINIKTIGKFNTQSSLKSVWDSGIELIVDIWNGNIFSFRDSSGSKKTNISVEVPYGGHIVITNSSAVSSACLYINLLDFFLTGAAYIDSTLKFNTDTVDYISRETIWGVLSTEYGTSSLNALQEEFINGYSKKLAEGSIFTLFGAATDNVQLMFDTFDIDLSKMIESAGYSYGFSVVQGILQKGGGPAGATLSAIFNTQKMLNFYLQGKCLIDRTNRQAAWMVYTPYLEDRGFVEITSSDGITASSDVGFPEGALLQTTKISDPSSYVSSLGLQSTVDCTVYDISLQSAGQAIQPEGTVTLRIPIPEGYTSIVVYRENQSGGWDLLQHTVDNGMIEVQVDYFGLLAVVDTQSLTVADIPFTDIKATDWFYDSVAYVVQNGLMQGVGGGKFNPSGTTSRGMIATILYRLEGEPAVSQSTFTDVAAGQWYTDAVAWAAANKIVEGYGNNTFGPNDNITREQMATILYRYAVYKGSDVSGLADLSGYADTETISNWALTAMRWANSEGLIGGRTATTLVPKGTTTRAEAATILMRFCQSIAGLE